MGAMAQLKELYLGFNEMADAGCSSLADALAMGAMASIETLVLMNNQATEAGKQALRDAAKARGLRIWV